MAVTGHQHPERNQPLLSTRELFLFKLNPDKASASDYLKLDTAGRRQLLAALAGATPSIEAASHWATPRHIDSIEWFASGMDLCGVMAHLAMLSELPGLEPLRGVLSKNPGMQHSIDRQAFPFVGYKGGSEVGVLNLTWLARAKNERWYVIELGVNHPGAGVETERVLAIAAGCFKLLQAELSP
jgi:hypothetical protein